MGADWDEERFCHYTGLPIFQAPDCDPNGNFVRAEPGIMYWRNDGVASRWRTMTEVEREWIRMNPAKHTALAKQVHAWLTEKHSNR